jgi:hypothetical protein
MTTKSLLISSATFAAGAMLFSCAAFAQPQPSGQPQSNQQQTAVSPGPSAPGDNSKGQDHGQGQAPQAQQPQAEAQPMAPTADVLLSFSATATQPAQAIAVAPDVDMLPITLYMTSTNHADGEFMHAMSGVCSGSAFLHNEAKTIAATGFCNYGDADGDQLFERFVIPLQSQDNPLEAAGHWTGGTGKYRNLQGGFVLTGVVLPTVADGIIQVVGQKRGRYAIEGEDQVQSQGQAPSAANQSTSGQAQ